jgi:hypothetical protein
MKRICAVAVFLLVGSPWASPPVFAQGRLRPPTFVTCDRNALTSFTGRVTELKRGDRTTELRIATDDDTRESLTLRHLKGEANRLMYRGGRPFTEADWSQVATPDGVKPGVRATAWVCSGDANPIIDWEIPAR